MEGYAQPQAGEHSGMNSLEAFAAQLDSLSDGLPRVGYSPQAFGSAPQFQLPQQQQQQQQGTAQNAQPAPAVWQPAGPQPEEDPFDAFLASTYGQSPMVDTAAVQGGCELLPQIPCFVAVPLCSCPELKRTRFGSGRLRAGVLIRANRQGSISH